MAGAGAGEQQALAVIIKAKGSVLYQAPGGSAWAPAAAGQTILAGGQVKTEADGLARVKFLSDGSMMKLKPQTHLTFEAREKGGLLLGMGAALFDVKKTGAKDKFTVTTPTSVATVKGTSFWVTSRGDSASTTVCLDGVVTVKSRASGKSKDVKRGYTALCDQVGLTLRATRTDDLPEQEQELEFRFKDANGNVKTLRIDAAQEQ
jgi:ferric-dicitrate binding protein FerR (iron transport regulator)